MKGAGLTISELEGRLYGMPYRNAEGKELWPPAEGIEDAEGLMFLCPTCYVDNGGSVGTHWVMCWSLKVGQEFSPNPGRWNILGTSLDDVSLVAGSSSVAITGNCGAHFWVTSGRIADRKLGDP